MTKEEKVKYWIDIADYDIGTAETLYTGGRWLYVAFMCHQVIEKTLKAYWCSSQKTDPPYTHNLSRIAAECGLVEQMSEEQLKFMDLMIPMNIEARYPSYKESLYRSLTPDFCRSMINKTKEFKQWIENKL